MVILITFLGGALVTGIVDGRAAPKTYFSRLVCFRAGIQWYIIALSAPGDVGHVWSAVLRVFGCGPQPQAV
ncbi:MAG: hypothetical protein P8Y03_28835 [Anaerolineales bacterium]